MDVSHQHNTNVTTMNGEGADEDEDVLGIVINDDVIYKNDIWQVTEIERDNNIFCLRNGGGQSAQASITYYVVNIFNND